MRFLVFLIAMMAPMPALALSCVAPSVERTFQKVNDAKEDYIVVHGRLTLDTDTLPKEGTTSSNPPKMTKVPATLTGLSLNRSGFEVPFEHHVTLEVACFGPWCGRVENGVDVLAFVRRDGGRYALGINPCGGHVFAPAQAAQLSKVQQCFNGGTCDSR